MPRNPTTGVFTAVVNSFSNPVLGEVIDPNDANALFADQTDALNDLPAELLTGEVDGTLTIGHAVTPKLILSPESGATKTFSLNQTGDVVSLSDDGVANRIQFALATGNLTLITGGLVIDEPGTAPGASPGASATQFKGSGPNNEVSLVVTDNPGVNGYGFYFNWYAYNSAGTLTRAAGIGPGLSVVTAGAEFASFDIAVRVNGGYRSLAIAGLAATPDTAGIVPNADIKWVLGQAGQGYTTLRIENSSDGTNVPAVEIRNTANVISTGGLWRTRVFGGSWQLQVNTAVAGDFSSSSNLLAANTSGVTGTFVSSSYNGLTITTTTGTLTLTNAKTFAVSNTLTLAGTDGSTLNIGAGGTLGTSAYITLGTGVGTALAVNVGTDGAFVVKGGALGSPSSVGTLPALTLGGTIAGGGNQINNVIIGTSTPLAGAFTTLSASGQISSTLATGTAPFSVASTTNVANLNASSLSGATFAAPGAIGGGTASTGAFTTLTSGAHTVTSASATALTVGLNGATNPAFTIDASTGSQAAGFKITGAATGGTVALVATDSGSNTNLTINAKGSGTIGIGSVSTGAVTITPALTLSAALTYGGVTLSNAVTGTGNMVLSAGATLTGTTTLASVAGAAVATQSDQETATSTSTIVTPGRQQYHPGMVKAWCYVTVPAGTPTISSSYNVTSITDNGAGLFAINLTTAFSAASYGAVASLNGSGVGNGMFIEVYNTGGGTFSASSLPVRTLNNGTAAADPASFAVLMSGDQ